MQLSGSSSPASRDSGLPPLPFTLRSAPELHDTYVSHQKVENSIYDDKGMELEEDVTTDTGEDTDDLLDYDEDIEFEYDGQEEMERAGI